MKKLIILFVLIICFSCEAEKDVENISNDVFFSFSPTQCSEKWQFGSTDSETISNIMQFLKENEIEVKSIEISKPDGKIYCAACTCPSGRTVDLKADIIYMQKLLKLGYSQKIIN